MPRKHNNNNPLQIKIRPVTLPKSVTPKRFFQTLLKAIDTGSDLPRGWEVDLHWRNPGTRHGLTKRWRSDAFVDAISDSREGFVWIVRSAIVARLRGRP